VDVFARESVWAEHLAIRELPVSRGRRNFPWSLRGLFLRSLLVDAANRYCEFRTRRISAATYDDREICRCAVGASYRSASDPDHGRASACDRKAQRHGGAEERNKKARGTDSPSTSAPRKTATKPVLELCFVSFIRFSSVVLEHISVGLNRGISQGLARISHTIFARSSRFARRFVRFSAGALLCGVG
jgi:hypothetical protein